MNFDYWQMYKILYKYRNSFGTLVPHVATVLSSPYSPLSALGSKLFALHSFGLSCTLLTFTKFQIFNCLIPFLSLSLSHFLSCQLGPAAAHTRCTADNWP